MYLVHKTTGDFMECSFPLWVVYSMALQMKFLWQLNKLCILLRDRLISKVSTVHYPSVFIISAQWKQSSRWINNIPQCLFSNLSHLWGFHGGRNLRVQERRLLVYDKQAAEQIQSLLCNEDIDRQLRLFLTKPSLFTSCSIHKVSKKYHFFTL